MYQITIKVVTATDLVVHIKFLANFTFYMMAL